MNKEQLQLELNARPLSFVIDGFPLPPSVNGLYAWVQGRMVKSKEYRDYEKKVHSWLVDNQEQIKSVRQFIKNLGLQVIHIDSVFHITKHEIICLNGKPKRNDTANRLKALHDVLASFILGIDDSYFWSCAADKIAVDGKSSACVNITLKLRNI